MDAVVHRPKQKWNQRTSEWNRRLVNGEEYIQHQTEQYALYYRMFFCVYHGTDLAKLLFFLFSGSLSFHFWDASLYLLPSTKDVNNIIETNISCKRERIKLFKTTQRHSTNTSLLKTHNMQTVNQKKFWLASQLTKGLVSVMTYQRSG